MVRLVIPKVSLLGGAIFHGLVVRMKMGVVVDFKSLGVERSRDLIAVS